MQNIRPLLSRFNASWRAAALSRGWLRCALAGVALCFSSHVLAQDTIKIGVIEPFSGPAAAITEAGQDTFKDYVRAINAQGGMLGKKLELVPYDNKVNPQESIVQIQKAIDNGVRIFMQAQSSSVALAITDFVQKYNTRNPGKEVLYLNYDSIDPALTNEKCNFWHFRFAAGVDMKTEALATFLADRSTTKKVYLINQDYSYGQAVSAEVAKRLKAKRPDIEIVGNELHPLLKVNDFTPYIAKIRASGADTVVTGNWGPDMSLLLKAGAASDLAVDWVTVYGDAPGNPAIFKQAGLKDRVFVLTAAPSDGLAKAEWDVEKARRTASQHATMYPYGNSMLRALVKAGNVAGVFDINKIAKHLEGIQIDIPSVGQGQIRAEDHQFIQPLYIGRFGDFDAKTGFEEENTGWGWHTLATIPAARVTVPTSCKMKRPA